MLPSLPPRTAQIVALAGSALLSGILLVVHGTVLTVLVLLALGTSLSFAAIAWIDGYTNRGGEPHRALATALLFLPLLVMFFRMPPIVYSLTVVPLPETIEYALYAPSVLLGATCILLAWSSPSADAVGRPLERIIGPRRMVGRSSDEEDSEKALLGRRGDDPAEQ